MEESLLLYANRRGEIFVYLSEDEKSLKLIGPDGTVKSRPSSAFFLVDQGASLSDSRLSECQIESYLREQVLEDKLISERAAKLPTTLWEFGASKQAGKRVGAESKSPYVSCRNLNEFVEALDWWLLKSPRDYYVGDFAKRKGKGTFYFTFDGRQCQLNAEATRKGVERFLSIVESVGGPDHIQVGFESTPSNALQLMTFQGEAIEGFPAFAGAKKEQHPASHDEIWETLF